MNIEQYRALKAEQENQPEVEETLVQEEEQPTPETKEEQPEVIKIEVDGEELTIDELKNGYLRQADYTKKTQEVSRQRKESEEAIKFYEYLKHNPEAVQGLQQNTKVPDRLDPATAKVIELEEKMYDMMLENEIKELSSKYDDFEIREVLEMASSKNMTNLEDAYKLLKSSNPSNIKEQVRKELLAEMQAEGVSTKTIINDTSTPPVAPKSEVIVTQDELRVAKGMGMSVQDYVTWRDA